MDRKEILEQIEKIKKQIEELNGQFIDFDLPKNYDKMSKEEKKAYHKKQEQLKRQALKDMKNYSVVDNNYTMVTYPKNRASVVAFKRDVRTLSSIPLERDVFKRTTSEKVKELHRKNLRNKKIKRYWNLSRKNFA